MNFTKTSTILMAMPSAVVRIPFTLGWISLLCMRRVLLNRISVIEPVGLDIVRKIEQSRMREMHGIEQRKRRPYVRKIQKRAAAAVDHDLPIPVLPRQQSL